MRDEGTWLGLNRRAKPLVQAGVALGVGIGGFFDGIVFHQILQLHHMMTSHPDPGVAGDLQLNVIADGLFHIVAWAFTIVGVLLLWRAWRLDDVPASGRTLFGSTLAGWGAFNLVEGILNHHLLGIHHVWADGPGSVILWDVAFLLWGLVFVVGGYVIARSDDAIAPRAARDRVPSDRVE